MKARIILSIFALTVLSLTPFKVLADTNEVTPCCSRSANTPTKLTRFSPGAEVKILLSVSLPEGYELGGDPSLLVTLDDKNLKSLGVRTDKLEYVFTDRELTCPFSKATTMEETRIVSSVETVGGNPELREDVKPASLTLMLPEEVEGGKISLPLKLTLFFCSKDEGYCTTAELARSVEVLVSEEADAVNSGVIRLCLEPTPEELLPKED